MTPAESVAAITARIDATIVKIVDALGRMEERKLAGESEFLAEVARRLEADEKFKFAIIMLLDQEVFMPRDLTTLVPEAARALARLETLEKSGSPDAIAAAKAELRNLKDEIETARADIVLQTAIAQALNRPMRLVR